VSASKRPSTSSLRRFITSRPYVTVAELRRRFGLDDPDGIGHVERNGSHAWIGLPEREAAKIQDLWQRDEVGLEFSVEVQAPVVVGVYPMRIARYFADGGANGASAHGAGRANGHLHGHRAVDLNPAQRSNGAERPHPPPAERPTNGAQSLGPPRSSPAATPPPAPGSRSPE